MMSTPSGNIKRFSFAGQIDAPYEADLCSVDNADKWERLVSEAHEAYHSLERDSVQIYNEASPDDSILFGDRIFTSRAKAVRCLMGYRWKWILVWRFNRAVVDECNAVCSLVPPSLIL